MHQLHVTEIDEQTQEQVVVVVSLIHGFVTTNRALVALAPISVILGLDIFLQEMIKNYNKQNQTGLN